MDTEKRSRGRPVKSPDELLEKRSLRLTPAQWAKIDAHGGLAWLRKVIDKAKLPKVE